MGQLSQKDQEVLAKDREVHPGCTHSKTISTSCRSVNGDRQCEILRRIFRNCPGKKKELILDRKNEIHDNQHSNEMDEETNPFRIFHGNMNERELISPFGNGNIDDIIQEMIRPFGMSPFGNGFSNRERSQSFGHDIPPHHQYESNQSRRQPRKKDIFDGFDGRVEDI